MEDLLLRVLTVSAACSAVLLPLLLLARRIRHRYAAPTLYVLFLLLALRLVLPVQLSRSAPAVTVEVPSYSISAPVQRPAPVQSQVSTLPQQPAGQTSLTPVEPLPQQTQTAPETEPVTIRWPFSGWRARGSFWRSTAFPTCWPGGGCSASPCPLPRNRRTSAPPSGRNCTSGGPWG